MEPIPSNEEWNRTLEKGRQAAQVTLLNGVPILGWQLLSEEQKEQGLDAYCWGLICGYDRKSKEYIIRHRDAGHYRVPYDLLGRCDPVNWF